jgi:TolB-like protein/DNA-binding winged helix-turn-helix (wHTH) protein/Tfp pilus assembly protein PilF
MQSPHNQVVRVGAWRVNPTLDEISKNGTTAKLEPRTMRLLVCLAEHAGQVLSVDQLLDLVWTDVVVTPNSVYQAVAELRRVLGDNPKEPVYIANVMRRGYRLVAPVAPWVDAPVVPEGEPPPLPATSIAATPADATNLSPSRRFGIALIVAAVVALALSYFVWLSKRNGMVEHARSALNSVVSDKSIAVLPFVDMSEKKDQQYFADGMAEEIIDRLARVPELYVPARTSSFYFRDKPTKIPDIAHELNVAHVLEGSLRKSGNHLRITAQLVRADNGYHVWSQSFDRELDDVFGVQDEIAGAVVKALKVSLLEVTAPRPIPTSSTEAYTLYLQARSIALRASHADYEEAVDYLKRALKLDPKFAAAWAALANDRIDDFIWPPTTPTAEIAAEAQSAAEQAVKLDPNLSDGHLAMARILVNLDWSWDAAEREFDRAMALDPGNADAARHRAYLAITLARDDQALQLAQLALTRDPLNSWNYFGIGVAYRVNNRLAESEAAYRKALELNPTGTGIHSSLGFTLLDRGEPAAALAEMERESNEIFRETTRPYALDALGRKSDADRELEVVENKYAASATTLIAVFYACRNDLDRAFDWLDRAHRQHDPGLIYLRANPCIGNLASDPRYKAFRGKMKLPL